MPQRMQLVTVGEKPLLYIPPPRPPALFPKRSSWSPWGGGVAALSCRRCRWRCCCSYSWRRAVGHRGEGGIVVHPAASLLAEFPEKEQLVTWGGGGAGHPAAALAGGAV
ncbi:MAG: hypothetical protein R2788_08845 [Saprospiraceae bacterium]